jgi:hypothetical protein
MRRNLSPTIRIFEIPGLLKMLRSIGFIGIVSLTISVLGCKDKDGVNPGPEPGNIWGIISDTLPDYVLYLSNREGGPIRQALKELYSWTLTATGNSSSPTIPSTRMS